MYDDLDYAIITNVIICIQIINYFQISLMYDIVYTKIYIENNKILFSILSESNLMV